MKRDDLRTLAQELRRILSAHDQADAAGRGAHVLCESAGQSEVLAQRDCKRPAIVTVRPGHITPPTQA